MSAVAPIPAPITILLGPPASSFTGGTPPSLLAPETAPLVGAVAGGVAVLVTDAFGAGVGAEAGAATIVSDTS